MSKVYFIGATSSERNADLRKKVGALWRNSDLGSAFASKDLTALKLHVGEPGTKTFVPPAVVAAIAKCIKACGADPFLTDSSVLYKSRRDNAVEHARVVQEHGFGINKMGAPFLPADGLAGADEIEVELGAKHYQKVAIASTILHARSMLVLTHATGHLGTGYGGALKNLGMGCASKKAKLRMHHGQQPHISEKRCTACGTCASWCPTDAISVEEVAVIDDQTCIGCGECIAACRDNAVHFSWAIMGRELQERIVEHAAAIVRAKRGHLGFVTVAMGITKDCDCMGLAQQPLVDDLGIVASLDPVAIDQAVMDLVRDKAGQSLESLSYPQADGTIQTAYAEALGLGHTRYDLVEL